MAVPLTGVVLVLATASAAALRQRRLAGWRLAVRLILLLVVAAAALVAVLWQTASENDQSVGQLLSTPGSGVLLVVVVLGVGWFLGRPDDPGTPDAAVTRGHRLPCHRRVRAACAAGLGRTNRARRDRRAGGPGVPAPAFRMEPLVPEGARFHGQAQRAPPLLPRRLRCSGPARPR